MVVRTYTVRVCRVFGDDCAITTIKVLGNVAMLAAMNDIAVGIRRRLPRRRGIVAEERR